MLEQVRETAQGFEVFGELGRRSDRDIWYLARDQADRILVALRLQQKLEVAGVGPEYSLEIARELDKEVPLGDGDCPKCRAKIRSFARFCGKCGVDLTAANRMPASREERSAMLETVRQAASEHYDVVGEMPWGGGRGIVYFAVERASGRLARLRLTIEGDEYALGETQAAMALKTRLQTAYTTAPVLAPAPEEAPRAAPTAGPIPLRARSSWIKIGLLVGGLAVIGVLAYLAVAR